MATLSTLPNEIISIIASHFDRPRDLLHLALTSRRLSQFAILDGWKALLKGRFHIHGLDTDARSAVHGLTTLYRNWDRKGFVARYLEPSIETTSLNTWETAPWRGPRGQTMGYQPSIDSYEEMLGSWSRRREVLTWSAGTQIVMRVKETEPSKDDDKEDKSCTVDAFGHANLWYTYKIPDGDEGRDDITSLQLLRPHQKEQGFESMVFGTASGHLARLDVDPQQSQTLKQTFDTLDRSVGALSISSSNTPLLAATLGDTSLSLFPLDCELSEDPIESLSEVTPTIQGARTGRIWSCSFLSPEKVAIGTGPSNTPIQIYKITPDGFLSDPYRSLTLSPSLTSQTSIYPLLPISSRTTAGSDAGTVFLSGGYDGIVRLHDLRSPRDVETLHWDPTNDSSIYALAAQGLSRVIVGVSMHSMLKVFDLRMAGSHAYSRIPLPKTQAKPPAHNHVSNSARTAHAATTTMSGGWNLYLTPRTASRMHRADSPVYSLSLPAATSTTLYAGLENTVQSLTFHSFADAHPDPLLSAPRFDPDILNLGMYTQTSDEDGGVDMHLLVQDEVSADGLGRGMGRKREGLDERWMDLRDEKERWVRGGARGGMGRGGARGRGRGRGRRGRR